MIFDQVKNTSQQIIDDRTPMSITMHLMSEVGELAEEVAIAHTTHYKKPGVDGIVGEVADTITCALDLLFNEHPEITEEQFSQIISEKLAKWQRSVMP